MFRCTVCGKEFDNPASLRAHINSAHKRWDKVRGESADQQTPQDTEPEEVNESPSPESPPREEVSSIGELVSLVKNIAKKVDEHDKIINTAIEHLSKNPAVRAFLSQKAEAPQESETTSQPQPQIPSNGRLGMVSALLPFIDRFIELAKLGVFGGGGSSAPQPPSNPVDEAMNQLSRLINAIYTVLDNISERETRRQIATLEVYGTILPDILAGKKPKKVKVNLPKPKTKKLELVPESEEVEVPEPEEAE